MKLTLLGTGNAAVTECFNTCFLLSEDGRHFLVDGGGGNQILNQLKKAGCSLQNVHHIFVTHKHIDHLLGIIWIVRMIGQQMNRGLYDGDAYIYAHEEVLSLLRDMVNNLLAGKTAKCLDKRVHLVEVHDGETVRIMDREVTFFDMRSTKAKQFGFCMKLDGNKKLTCCGDEPYAEHLLKYAQDSDWMLHEAFCLSSEADVFHPYEKNHSTVKDACETAERLGVKNLVLYHTEDSDIAHRKERYLAEGSQYYHGNLFVPDDLEVISIDD